MNCKKPKTIAKCILLLSLVLLDVPPLPACADNEQSAVSIVLQQPGAREGKAFLGMVLDRLKAIQDYKFESTLTCYAKAKPVTESGCFYFKSPNLIRFEAMEAHKIKTHSQLLNSIVEEFAARI